MSRPMRTSPALRIFVPAYLVVIGVGLLVGAAALLIYSPDEWFVMLMALVGGLTMLATAGAMLTVARDR